MADFAAEESSSSSSEWVEVTSVVRSAMGAFAYAELVHDGGFCLSEAMSAIELMDPKMDVPSTPMPRVELLLEKGVLPQVSVLVLEELLTREMDFADGKAYNESIEECAYCGSLLARESLDDAAKVDDVAGGAVAACASLALCIAEATRAAVEDADLFEEEDYSSRPGRSFFGDSRAAPRADVEGTMALVAKVLPRLADDPHLKAHLSLRSAYLAFLSSADLGEKGSVLSSHVDDVEEALKVLDTFRDVTEDDAPGQWRRCFLRGVASTPLKERRAKALDTFRNTLVPGLRGLAELRTYLETTPLSRRRRKRRKATTPDDDSQDDDDQDDDDDQEDSEDDSSSPREVVVEECHVLARTETLVRRISRSSRLILPRSLAALEVGCVALRHHRPHVAVLGRGPRAVAAIDAVDDAVKCAGAPACVAVAAEAYASFVAKVCVVALEALRDLSLTSARLLPRLRDHLLHEYGDAKVLADRADDAVAVALGLLSGGGLDDDDPAAARQQQQRHRYLGTFVSVKALECAALYLDLLLELNLCVDLTELEVVFFYSQYVFAARLRVSADARHYKDALQRELGGCRPEAAAAVFEAEVLYVDARRELARGLYALAAALIRGPLEADLRALPFGSGEARFDARFGPFDCLAHVAPRFTYDDFRRFTRDLRDAPHKADVLNAASDQLLHAKNLLQTLLARVDDDDANDPASLLDAVGVDRSTVVGLAKTAVANRVVAAKALMRGGDKDLYGEKNNTDKSHTKKKNNNQKKTSDKDDLKKRALRRRVADLDHRFHPSLPVLRDPADA